MYQPKSGAYHFHDIGQNLVLWLHLTVRGVEVGLSVRPEHKGNGFW